MKDGFELAPTLSGLFLLKNVFVIKQLELIFAAPETRGIRLQSLSVEGPFV